MCHTWSITWRHKEDSPKFKPKRPPHYQKTHFSFLLVHRSPYPYLKVHTLGRHLIWIWHSKGDADHCHEWFAEWAKATRQVAEKTQPWKEPKIECPILCTSTMRWQIVSGKFWVVERKIYFANMVNCEREREKYWVRVKVTVEGKILGSCESNKQPSMLNKIIVKKVKDNWGDSRPKRKGWVTPKEIA